MIAAKHTLETKLEDVNARIAEQGTELARWKAKWSDEEWAKRQLEIKLTALREAAKRFMTREDTPFGDQMTAREFRVAIEASKK